MQNKAKGGPEGEVSSLAKRASGAGALVETLIASVAISTVAVLVTLESVLRYVFRTSLYGLEEITVVIGVYAYFIGSACASRDRAHIRVNVIDSLPILSRNRRIVNAGTDFIASIVCFIFAYYTFVYCQVLQAQNVTITPIGWPLAAAALSLLLGLVFMGTHNLVQFLQSFWKA